MLITNHISSGFMLSPVCLSILQPGWVWIVASAHLADWNTSISMCCVLEGNVCPYQSVSLVQDVVHHILKILAGQYLWSCWITWPSQDFICPHCTISFYAIVQLILWDVVTVVFCEWITASVTCLHCNPERGLIGMGKVHRTAYTSLQLLLYACDQGNKTHITCNRTEKIEEGKKIQS